MQESNINTCDNYNNPACMDYTVVFLNGRPTVSSTSLLALEHLNAGHVQVHTFADLLTFLSSCAEYPTAICIHLQTLVCMEKVDIVEAVNTIRTMSRCKVPDKSIPIGILVDKTTEQKMLKQLTTLDIHGMITEEDLPDLVSIEDAFRALFTGHAYRSASFVRRLHAKPKVVRREDPNQVRLTARQDQIARLICTRGASNKVIARLLDISESTVKLHVSAIFKKFGVKNRTQLALFSKNMHTA